jgi:hypothetical protein
MVVRRRRKFGITKRDTKKTRNIESSESLQRAPSTYVVRLLSKSAFDLIPCTKYPIISGVPAVITHTGFCGEFTRLPLHLHSLRHVSWSMKFRLKRQLADGPTEYLHPAKMEKFMLPFGMGLRRCIGKNLALHQLHETFIAVIYGEVLDSASMCQRNIEMVEWLSGLVVRIFNPDP